MPVEKTPESGDESRDYGPNPNTIIEGQRAAAKERLGSHKLISAIEALFG